MVRLGSLVALSALLACARPKTSPDYERAGRLWVELVKSHGADAAEDPGADEVLWLLDRVPRDSLDAAAAAALKGRIEGERKSHIEELKRREALLARVGASGSVVVPEDTVVSAAPAPPPPISAGMTLSAFQAAYGECFQGKGRVEIAAPDGGPSRAGEMWVMKGEDRCKGKFPSLADQAVLFADGVLAGVSPLSSMKQIEVRREVMIGLLPDGGLGELVDGGVVPFPPGARLLVRDAGTP